MKVMNLLPLLILITLVSTEEIEFLEPNGFPIMEKIAGLSNGILSIMNGIQSVLQAFKSSKSTIIKQIIQKEGFNSFVGKTTIFVSQGVAGSNLKNYTTTVFNTLAKIPAKHFATVNDFMENIKYVDGDAWSSYDFLFDNGDPADDTTSYFTLIGTHNFENDNYDLICITNKIDFKLAPNLMIMQDSLSVAGGIYSHQKERIVELPRSITKEEIQLIMTFFQGVSFKALGKMFGMDLPNFS